MKPLKLHELFFDHKGADYLFFSAEFMLTVTYFAPSTRNVPFELPLSHHLLNARMPISTCTSVVVCLPEEKKDIYVSFAC